VENLNGILAGAKEAWKNVLRGRKQYSISKYTNK
jgi:hypothetical protein